MFESESSSGRNPLAVVRGNAVYVIRSAVFRDSAILLLGNGISAALGFLAAVIISRTLGPSDFGIISTAVAVTVVLTGLTDLGIGTGLVRFAARDIEANPARASALFIATLKLELALGALILIAAGSLARPLAMLLGGSESLVSPLMWAFLAGFGLSVSAYNSAVLQTYLKFKRLAILMVIYSAAKFLGLLFLLAIARLTVGSVLILYAVLAVANLGLGFLLIPRDSIGAWNAPGQREALTELFSLSKWVMLSFFATSIAGRLDIFMLSHFRDAAEVGHYAAAFQLASVFPLIIGAISTSLLPRVSRLADAEHMSAFVRRTLGLSVLIVVALLPLLLVSSELVTALFGPRYAASISSFQILFLAFLLAIVVNPISLVLYTLDRAWVITIVNYVQVLFAFLLDLILVPAYGSTGAATTFLLTGLLAFFAIGYAIWHRLHQMEMASPAVHS